MIKVGKKEEKKHRAFFDPGLNCFYVSGIEELDNYLVTEQAVNDCIKVQKKLVNESRKKIQSEVATGFEVVFCKKCILLKKKYDPEDRWMFVVPYEGIKSVIVDTKFEIEEQAKGSVVGRGLAGAVFLGPLGALIGGMSAVGQKSVNALQGALISIVLSDAPEKPINFFGPERDERLLDTSIKLFRKKLGDKLQRA